ncbi:hypothetical protein AALP_AA1G082800 [Arabis alpina]|uniref:Uncharacterized protein n=1 Tax=Arabis alpina TaxID=50452 RepID=A0A087HLW9_ARAAL|nr:hypothetical protein AALP_AA1G082800 [Arabis alpina]
MDSLRRDSSFFHSIYLLSFHTTKIINNGSQDVESNDDGFYDVGKLFDEIKGHSVKKKI